RLLGATTSSLVLAVYNNNTGTGTPIATPVLVSPNSLPILSQASIQFLGNGGDDSFTNFTSLPSAFDGGGGVNTFVGGSGTDTVVASGDMNMTLSNGKLSGPGAADTLTSVERAILTGGPGANTLDARNFTGSVTFDGGGGADILLGGGGNDSFIIRSG